MSRVVGEYFVGCCRLFFWKASSVFFKLTTQIPCSWGTKDLIHDKKTEPFRLLAWSWCLNVGWFAFLKDARAKKKEKRKSYIDFVFSELRLDWWYVEFWSRVHLSVIKSLMGKVGLLYGDAWSNSTLFGMRMHFVLKDRVSKLQMFLSHIQKQSFMSTASNHNFSRHWVGRETHGFRDLMSGHHNILSVSLWQTTCEV